MRRRMLAAVAAVGLLVVLTGCGQGAASGGASGDAENPTIGVLFPDNKTPQWENRFWPSIRDAIKRDCADCEVLYANVASDPAEQQNQADSMLAQGIKALILAPVNADAATAIVAKADAQNVPVIGFGSVPEGDVAAFVGVDIVELGRLQGATLLEQLQAGGDPKRGCVVALDGDAQTPGTQEFLDGRKESLDPFVDICRETNITNWDPANAQTAMDQVITALGKDSIIGVYGMNDGIISGAVAAMVNAGFTTPFPPSGGQDNDLAAIQRILSGQQGFTINARNKEWGDVAGPVALQAARGEKLTSDQEISNTTTTFPWFTTPAPVAVTIDNIQTAVIDTGYYTYDEICTTDYKEACDAADLEPAA